MSTPSALSLRCVLAVLVVQLASACDSPPPPQPPPASDTTAPTTRATPAGGQYSGSITVALLCEDGEGSGCAATHYTTDGSEPTRASPAFRDALSLTADTTLRFFSVDGAGNAEAPREQRYSFTQVARDTQAPTTSVVPAGGFFSTPPTVALACEDTGGSGCRAMHYTLDGSEPTPASPTYSVPLVLSGNTVLRFFAVDAAGNAEPVKTQTYTLDARAPTTVASPTGGASNTPRSVTLTCEDGAGGSGCAATYYTLDGTPPTTRSPRYTAPLFVTATATLSFFSVDRADNAEAVRTERYVLDTTAPQVAASPAGGPHDGARMVTLSCDDADGSGCAAIHYTLNGGAPTPLSPVYASPIPVSASATLRFFALDVAGNASPVAAELYIIDSVGPTTRATPAGGISRTAVNVTLACEDGAGGSGCVATHYTLDGSTPTRASARYTGTITLTTSTVLKFLSVDAAGNAGPVGSEQYTLDFAAPATTASPAGGTFRTAQAVTLACDDGAGTGCAATYYTLDGSTPTTASARYSGPLSVSQSLALKFFSVDVAGNAGSVVTQQYLMDGAAPVTTATPAGGTYAKAQTVTLACADGAGGSGCAATYYTLDGSTPTTDSPRYSAPVSIPADTVLRFLSVDAAGNLEAARSESYVIDTAAPTTVASPTGGTYGSAQSVTLACDDGSGSGCAATYYTTDGTSPTPASTRYTGPVALNTSAVLRFFSVDVAGTAEPVRVQSYTIDTAPPVTSPSPAGGAYASAQQVMLSCADATTACEATWYTTDGTTPTEASPRFTGTAIPIPASTSLKFFSVDSVGNREAVRTETYVIDTVVPVTTASPAGGTYRTTQSVTLTCNDGTGTGCAATYYTTDGTTPTSNSPRYTGTALTVAADTLLRFYSVDAAGNAEAARVETYTIDGTAPSVVASPASGTYRSARSVTLTCSDGGSGCAATHYTLDGSTPTTASATYSAPLSIAANTVLKFFAVDRAGNASPVQTETYVIDGTPPTTTASPAGGTYRTAQSVTLTCNDGSGSGCGPTYFTTDGSAPTTSSPRYTGTALTISANLVLRFFSVDLANNSEVARTETYVIDGTAPTVSATPPGGSYTSAQSVTLACSDGTGTGCAAIHYTLDGSVPTTASPVYSAPLNLSSNTVLKFFAVDRAGNASPVQTETYTIDGTPPVTTATPAGGTYRTAQSVTLTCNDGSGSGCGPTYFTTDGSAPTTSSPRYTGTPIPIGDATVLKFFSVDVQGNTEAVRTETYVIDGTAPTVSATPPGGGYTSAQSVTLACNDGTGTGCAAIHYTLDGSVPTTSSPVYTSPLFISSTTNVRFFGVDRAGNPSGVRTESYLIDSVPPTTSALPPGGRSSGSVTVTLSCSDATSGCAATYYTVDGTPPTSDSPLYSGPLTVHTTTTLKFFSVDALGNMEPERTEVYTIDSTPPLTTASPSSGSFDGPLTVALTCDDADGTGCAATYYTVDGTTPTSASPTYSEPLAITTTTTLLFYSVDGVGNAEPVRVETYQLPTTPAETSEQIRTVRAAVDGSLNLPVWEARVTYIKPLTGTDPAGFFLQAEPQGPGLFVAVDPATLTPSPLPGDSVSLTVVRKSTVNGLVQVTAITDFTVVSRGNPVAPLLTDASDVDITAQLGEYDSEYLRISGTLTTSFTFAGTAHSQANLTTLGVPPDNTHLRLRVLDSVNDVLGLGPGCSVTVTAPLWRFNTAAQMPGWTTSDVEVHSCPPPKVASAVATSAQGLMVRFDRLIDPASVAADGSQFTFSNGLAATSASVQGRDVTVGTSQQTSGQAYDVTVASSVMDLRGQGVDAAANSASFTGFQPAQLRINEVNPNIPNGRDLVELLVVGSGTTQGFTLVVDTGVVATLPPAFVAAGDLIVVHLNPNKNVTDGPASETLSKSEHPKATYSSNYDSAWDFHGGSSGISATSNRVLRLKDASGTTQDAVPFAYALNAGSNYPTYLQALQAEGLWQPPDCLGVPCTYTSSPTAVDVSVSWAGLGSTPETSAHRLPGGQDTDTQDDWTVSGLASFGEPNR